ncbi:hypothetical protein ALC53_08097 [Atta colombica]|uniref:Uncharacterized protein n=1 Tax=Atta colombica TaxID=520822 RepID=A0A195BAW0_9HYME|nr:hypothetical protein ALC53_08097 [Atta colombica]
MRVCACFTSAPRMFADSKLCRTMPAEPLSLADYKTRKNVKSPRMPFCRPVMEIVDTLTSPYPANWNMPLFLPKQEKYCKIFDCVSRFELIVGVPFRNRVGRRSEIPRDNAFIVPRNPITPDAGAAMLLSGHRDIAMDTRKETRRRRRRRLAINTTSATAARRHRYSPRCSLLTRLFSVLVNFSVVKISAFTATFNSD